MPKPLEYCVWIEVRCTRASAVRAHEANWRFITKDWTPTSTWRSPGVLVQVASLYNDLERGRTR